MISTFSSDGNMSGSTYKSCLQANTREDIEKKSYSH